MRLVATFNVACSCGKCYLVQKTHLSRGKFGSRITDFSVVDVKSIFWGIVNLKNETEEKIEKSKSKDFQKNRHLQLH